MPPAESSPWGRHLLLLSASPDFNSLVRGPNISIRLHFNSKIDLKHSKLVLFGPDAAHRALAFSNQTSPDLLVSEVKGLARGSYALGWQVLAADGSVTRGEVAFRVDSKD